MRLIGAIPTFEKRFSTAVHNPSKETTYGKGLNLATPGFAGEDLGLSPGAKRKGNTPPWLCICVLSIYRKLFVTCYE